MQSFSIDIRFFLNKLKYFWGKYVNQIKIRAMRGVIFLITIVSQVQRHYFRNLSTQISTTIFLIVYFIYIYISPTS